MPHGLRMIVAASKFGIQLPPVGNATSLIVAVLPLYVPTPPNHDCWLPAGVNANHSASKRWSGSTSSMSPCPLCAGSNQLPVKLASIAMVEASVSLLAAPLVPPTSPVPSENKALPPGLAEA